MQNSSVRPTGEIERAVDTYGDALYRLCIVMLKNDSDAQDAVQETFIRYMQKAPQFRDPGHEKAWLITVAANKCRDMLRFKSRHPQVSIDAVAETAEEKSSSGIMETLMTLPEKYRLVLMLHYVEEYPVADIAKIIGKTPSAVKMRLQKGRKLLEEAYRKEFL